MERSSAWLPWGMVAVVLESPLEKPVKRALDRHSKSNDGFLRSNSVLAVVFITDEDDCSVQMSARRFNNPDTIDCSNATQSPLPASCFRNDFRCLANNIKCTESLTSTGVKTNCTESGNGYLESVDKYVRFFSQLRGPGALVLAGIWTPSMLDNPGGDPARDGKLELDYDDLVCVPGSGMTCGTEALNRGKGAKAACQNKSDAKFFGQAQLRLSKFVRNFPSSARIEQSVCEPQNFGAVLDVVAERITKGVSAYCLTAAPKQDQTGAPLCVVGLIDEGDSTQFLIPNFRRAVPGVARLGRRLGLRAHRWQSRFQVTRRLWLLVVQILTASVRFPIHPVLTPPWPVCGSARVLTKLLPTRSPRLSVRLLVDELDLARKQSAMFWRLRCSMSTPTDSGLSAKPLRTD